MGLRWAEKETECTIPLSSSDQSGIFQLLPPRGSHADWVAPYSSHPVSRNVFYVLHLTHLLVWDTPLSCKSVIQRGANLLSCFHLCYQNTFYFWGAEHARFCQGTFSPVVGDVLISVWLVCGCQRSDSWDCSSRQQYMLKCCLALAMLNSLSDSCCHFVFAVMCICLKSLWMWQWLCAYFRDKSRLKKFRKGHIV